MNITNFITLAALTTEQPTSGCAQYGNLGLIAIMVVALAAFMFFSSKKQKKQDQQIADMRNNLHIGDEVTTTGGIVGRVVNVKEETVVIETSRDGTKIRFLKTAILRVDRTYDTKQS